MNHRLEVVRCAFRSLSVPVKGVSFTLRSLLTEAGLLLIPLADTAEPMI